MRREGNNNNNGQQQMGIMPMPSAAFLLVSLPSFFCSSRPTTLPPAIHATTFPPVRLLLLFALSLLDMDGMGGGITAAEAATTATGAGSSREPRTFNLRDPDHPDLLQALDQGLLHRYTGGNSPPTSSASPPAPEHFRLLELDGDHLLIGAADAVHNLSLHTFQPVNIYRWEPGQEERHDCRMKSMDEGLCRNFVRVLGRLSHGRLLVCGTNAFRPACRVLAASDWSTQQEFSGVGLAPPEPSQNSSHLLSAGDMLYSATVTDFAGIDPLLFRRNVSNPMDRGLRTQRGNALQLDRPQFVGELQTEQFVYLFFREEGVEADFHPASFSRVARICKSDRGGPRHYGQEWTSFVKARLNCSLPGGTHRGRPFYFDQLVALTQPVHDGLVYATFVSEFDFLRHSVICAFRLDQIDQIFRSGPFVAYDPVQNRWTRRPRDELTAGLGQCQPDSSRLSEDEALAKRRFPLMADAVPNAFPGGAAAGIYRGDDHYSQIVVLPGIRYGDDPNAQADVLYVATDQGNVLKLANLGGGIRNNNTNNVQGRQLHGWPSSASSDGTTDPLLPISTLQLANAPIRRLLITTGNNSSSSSASSLIVVTDTVVYRLPLHFCDFYTSCGECVGSRDPHCVWHRGSCKGREEAKAEGAKLGGINGKLLDKREMLVQDVLGQHQDGQVCSGLETATGGGRREVLLTKKKSTTVREGSGWNSQWSTNGRQQWRNAANNNNSITVFYNNQEEFEKDSNKQQQQSSLAHHHQQQQQKCKCAANLDDGHVGVDSKCECPELAPEQMLHQQQRERGTKSLVDGNNDDGDERTDVGTGMAWIRELQALPWWVLLLMVLATLQTMAFVWLCCRRCRHNRGKLLSPSRGATSGSSHPCPLHAERRPSPSSNFSLPYTTNSSVNSAVNASAKMRADNGLISAYSPASLLTAPTTIGAKKLQSDHHHWTLNTPPSSNRSSSTSSPKGSADFVVSNNNNNNRNSNEIIMRKKGGDKMMMPMAGGSGFGGGILHGWNLMMAPRRASVSGGEISVQLEGSAIPRSGYTAIGMPPSGNGGMMTLPLHLPPPPTMHRYMQQQQQQQQSAFHQQQQSMSTFRR